MTGHKTLSIELIEPTGEQANCEFVIYSMVEMTGSFSTTKVVHTTARIPFTLISLYAVQNMIYFIFYKSRKLLCLSRSEQGNDMEQ